MLYLWIPFLLTVFFVWATILETVAHFLIHGSSFNATPDNSNPSIHNRVAIPLLLRAACAVSFLAAFYTYLPEHPIYFIFISALWITVYTDLNYMLISRLVSLYLVPVGFIASALGLLAISLTEAVLAAAFAGGFLMTTNAIFKIFKGHDGLGQGDIELLAFIGAWIGFLGTWCTIVIASTLGTIVGAAYLLWTRQQTRILPFGPFLAFGALMFLRYSETLGLLFF